MGDARTPPMGWSSWYAFGQDVDQAKMEATFAALTSRSIKPGSNSSLLDAGYVFANLDDGWQACNAGVDGSFHSADGVPLVNTTRFPNIRGMTKGARDLGLRPGFYYNNYICGEGMPKGGIGGEAYMRNMRGSVEFLKDVGFDFVKVDSGSVYNDMQLWHDLIQKAGRPITIENCHQGHELPNETWCPFDTFRTSGDLHVVGMDVALLAAARFLDKARVGCWAYPDTLDPGPPAQVRTQFGAHAVMSAPLILSFDLLDTDRLLPIWDILTNPEAIRVNQVWAGSPGRLLRKWSQYTASDPMFAWVEPCQAGDVAQSGWSYDASTSTVSWTPASGDKLCLASGGPGGTLQLQTCREGRGQRWKLDRGRLWEGQAESGARPQSQAPPVGVLGLQSCNASSPGQAWEVGHVGTEAVIRNQITFRPGGCMEITACSDAEGAQVDVLWGCKPLPPPGWTDPCEANMAWVFKEDGRIVSTMNGKCLQVDPHNPEVVNVGACVDGSHQRWLRDEVRLKSLDAPGQCIDSGVTLPPIGTTGRCAEVQVTGGIGDAGVLGPALQLASADKCDPDQDPIPGPQAIAFDGHGGATIVADELCVGGRHGLPTPFGPLQLWSKPQLGGAAAVVIVNRADSGTDVRIKVSELPGLEVGAEGVFVRDIWERVHLEPVIGDELQVHVPGGDSRFLLLSPRGKKPAVSQAMHKVIFW